jgi:hypothetical protein
MPHPSACVLATIAFSIGLAGHARVDGAGAKPRSVDASPGRQTEKAAVALESASIKRFVEQNWSVQLKRGSLANVVGYIMGKGLALGDRMGKAELRNRLQAANSSIGIAGLRNGRKLPVLKLPLAAKPPRIFEPAADAVERAVASRFGVSARPNAPLPEDEFAEPTVAPFEGAELHPSLAVVVPGFAEQMSPESVKYHLERNRSPLSTMVAAILRQAMTLRMRTLEAMYGPQIAARERDALAAMRLRARDTSSHDSRP